MTEEMNSNSPEPQAPAPEKKAEQSTSRFNEQPPKSGGGCLKAFLILSGVGIIFAFIGTCLIVVLALIGAVSQNPSTSKHFMEEYVSGDKGSINKIVVIDINGIILSGDGSPMYTVADSTSICEQLDTAQKDPAIKAVILRLNTPGGEVTASDVIHHKVLELRAGGIPVIASMEAVAASGGYYVAVGCDHIIANRLTMTGSVGVIAHTYNYHQLLNKIGIQSEVYKSGDMKDMLNGGRPRNEEEKAVMQGLIDDTYNEFVEIVASGRKDLTVEQIKDSIIGDGRVFHGDQALELKMIDQLGYFEDAEKKAAELAGIGKNYKLIRYQQPFSFSQLFRQVQAPTKNIKIEFPGNTNQSAGLESGRMYFLPCRW
jgi:protease-4